MKRFRWRENRWGAYTFAICAGVILFVILDHLNVLWGGLMSFLGFCRPVIYGIVLAYIMDPLARFLQRTLFVRVRKPKMNRMLSVAVTTILVVVLFVVLLVMLIPQLISSVTGFLNNMSSYEKTVGQFLEQIAGAAAGSASHLDLSGITGQVNAGISNIINYLTSHAGSIVETISNVGNGIVLGVISFILAIYCLADKKNLLAGLRKLFVILLPDRGYHYGAKLYHKCNGILSRYIVCELIDALIVGVANAVFMAFMNMPYITLISVVVGVTNLAPTFGPIVGCVIGAFILFLSHPWFALFFILFTIVLQTIDGYVIKPRLFGSALSVPSVWILIAITVGGRMFGVAGVLLGIPFAAIIAYLLRELLTDAPERKEKKEKEAALAAGTED